jgi:hypothetical protein
VQQLRERQAAGRRDPDERNTLALRQLLTARPHQEKKEVNMAIDDLAHALLRTKAAGVGDITSDAKGSGARYNTGKPAYELVPLRIIAESYYRLSLNSSQRDALDALFCLAEFQERGSIGRLYAAIKVLGIGGWPECAKVFDYGATKYRAWNWSKGMAWSIPIACAARHLLQIIDGEMLDLDKEGAPGSGLPHRGHVFCNLVMLITYDLTFREGDDRAPPGMLRPLTEVGILEAQVE